MDKFIVRLILRELQSLAARLVFSNNHKRIFRVDGRRLMLELCHRCLDVVGPRHAVRVQSELLGCLNLARELNFVRLDLADLLDLPLDVVFTDVLYLVDLLQEALDARLTLALVLQLFRLLSWHQIHGPFVDLDGVLLDRFILAFSAQRVCDIVALLLIGP